MRVFAYCAESFKDGVREAAGIEPVTSPPLSAETFEPSWLEDQDLIFFDLHGEPEEAFWRGDDGIVALTAARMGEADLGGAVVFATTCYLGDEDSPMLDALLDAGASYVVGGDGRNWAGERTVYGASLLGQRFRRLLRRGIAPLRALALAKRWIRLSLVASRILGRKGRVQAEKDTLAFRAYYRRDKDEQETEGQPVVV